LCGNVDDRDAELGLAGGLSWGDRVASDKDCSQNRALLTLLYYNKNDGLDDSASEGVCEDGGVYICGATVTPKHSRAAVTGTPSPWSMTGTPLGIVGNLCNRLTQNVTTLPH